MSWRNQPRRRIVGGPGGVRTMIFTVHGEHPDGDHSEFVRITAAGAVFKAADLMGHGYTSVHICDQNSQIFGLIPSINSSSCDSRAPSGPTRRRARGPSLAETMRRKPCRAGRRHALPFTARAL